MTKEDKISKLQALINEHKNESDSKLIEKIKAIIEHKSNKPFMPEVGQLYFVALPEGVRAFTFGDSTFTNMLLKSCTPHETRKSAKLEYKRKQVEIAVTRRLRELEGDWVADYSNQKQEKYFPCIYMHNGDVSIVCEQYRLVCKPEWVSSLEAWEQVLKEMPSQVKLMMTGSE